MRSYFIEIISEISYENKYKYLAFSNDWIIQLEKNENKKIFIFGYLFPCNSAVASEIAKEKPATSIVLENEKIPCILHRCFLNANHALAGSYVGASGSFAGIFEFFENHRQDVVLKPLKGTGGLDVFRCRSMKEVESATCKIFAKEYGLAACPFLYLGHEYRVVVLAGQVKLIYRKSRLSVEGDGSSSLEALLIEKTKSTHDASWKAVAEALGGFSCAELKSVPDKGKEIPIQWKHNLGQGLSSVDLNIDDTLRMELSQLAIRAAKALDICFCSVDIAETQQGQDPLVVVEVNCGVMMDAFSGNPARRLIAKAIYAEAIKCCFELSH